MNAMKIASTISGLVVFFYTFILLFQLWGEGIPADIFLKLTISAIIIVVVLMGLALMYREYIEDKSMRDDDYIA